MSISTACISGVHHEGEPTGRTIALNGVETYVTLPEGDYAKNKAILMLTDVFGLALNNNKLLADDFARNGFAVYVPDYFNGDPIPKNALNQGGFNRETWFANHGPAQTRPPLDKVIAALKENGITQFGATGYCFGARYVLDLMHEHICNVGVIAHPSRLKPTEDFEKLVEIGKAPLLINSCEVDSAFPAESCKIADEVLGDGKYKPGYKRVHWEGCTHGFAVRGDMSNPQVKSGKEGAFKESVMWFAKL